MFELFRMIVEGLADLGFPVPRWARRHEGVLWAILLAILGVLLLLALWRVGLGPG
jgi:hypothetical protein